MSRADNRATRKPVARGSASEASPHKLPKVNFRELRRVIPYGFSGRRP